MSHPIVSRIAPTPSGFLHLGNAFNFLLTWLLVRKAGGKLILRIDDMDQSRKRHAYVADIFRLIDWLGIDYDEGPAGPDELEQEWSQLSRFPLYREMMEQLVEKSLLFGCRCTRSEIFQLAPDGAYPGTCYEAAIPLKAGAAFRYRTPDSKISWQDLKAGVCEISLQGHIKDFVVWKKDGFPAYQLSSLADDLHFGVNLIVRGTDLMESTAAQRFLATAVEGESFLESAFYHHALLTGEQGEKLSKSAGSGRLSLRDQYTAPAEVIRQFCHWIGLETVDSTAELLRHFPERVDSH